VEIYVALGKAGLIAVPINSRLTPDEIRDVVDDCGATAFVVQNERTDRVEEIRDDLDIQGKRYVCFGGSTTPSHFQSYEFADSSEPAAPTGRRTNAYRLVGAHVSNA
jgi:fatty-acyl-CoA synthase